MDDEEIAAEGGKYHYFYSLIYAFKKYFKKAKKTGKINFDIRDTQGYTILGVATLGTIGLPLSKISCMSDHSGFFSLYFDLFDLAAIFGYKFSETLRKSKNDKV